MADRFSGRIFTLALRRADTVFVLAFYWLNIVAVATIDAIHDNLVYLGLSLIIGAMTTGLWLRAENGVGGRLATGLTLGFFSTLIVNWLGHQDWAFAGAVDKAILYHAVAMSVLFLWVDWRPLMCFALGVIGLDFFGLGLSVPHTVSITSNLGMGMLLLPVLFGWVMERNHKRLGKEQLEHELNEQTAEAEDKSEWDFDRAMMEHQGAGSQEDPQDLAERLQEAERSLSDTLNTVLKLEADNADLMAQMETHADDRKAWETQAREIAKLLSSFVGELHPGEASGLHGEDEGSEVETVQALTTQLAASSQSIGEILSANSQEVAAASSNAMQTKDRVSGLAEAAERIGEVVVLIQSIADKTNLLALNATIEAARAGDAGRGFAVVAAEVKDLAQQTSQATGQITEQVEAIQSQTDGVVEAIGAVAQAMDGMLQQTTNASGVVDEFRVASAQQSDRLGKAIEQGENLKGKLSRLEQTTDTLKPVLQALCVALEKKQKSGSSKQDLAQDFLVPENLFQTDHQTAA